MADNLFNTFQSVSKAAFKERILKDLKKEEFDASLLWTAEDQTIQPFYHAEDVQQFIQAYDGKMNEIQDSGEGRQWKIMEVIKVDDPNVANQYALNVLMHGAEAICFDLQQQPLTEQIYTTLLNNIMVEVAPVQFANFSKLKVEHLATQVRISQDVITQQLLQSVPAENISIDLIHQQLATSTAFNLRIDAAVYQNAGATITDQLAFTLALLSEYLQSMEVNQHQNVSGIAVHFAVGSNFFFEVAKLRAARKLIQVALKQFQLEKLPISMEVSATGINKSTLDAYNNMLRNTAEAMAAILGGADIIQLNAHDTLTQASENGKRWARNIGHILRKESYFDLVNDPAKGSYYVETLTDALAETAWTTFQFIEANGGFLASVQSRFIPNRMTENVEKMKTAAADKSLVLVGVNKYVPKEGGIVAEKAVANSPSFLNPVRLAEAFEGKSE
jgi:methylmalonyl-CoA mutase